MEQEELVVLEGRHGDLFRQVRVSGNERNLMMMLHVHQGGRLLAASGMGGAELGPGELINDWRGRSDQMPYFVMVRTAPSVERIVAVTELGAGIEPELSPVIAAHGLRSAVAGLPGGDAPGRLEVVTDASVLTNINTPVF